MLPRRVGTAAQARAALGNAVFQVGVMLAIQRNRWRKTQEELAAEIGCSQTDISAIELGRPPSISFSEAKLKKLFKTLELDKELQLRELLKWWQKHA
jgi:transcriptional regulator with XRE-family HTH domain